MARPPVNGSIVTNFGNAVKPWAPCPLVRAVVQWPDHTAKERRVPAHALPCLCPSGCPGVGGSLGQPVPSSPRSGRGLPRPACRLSGLPAGPGVRPAQRYLWPGQCPAAGRPGPGQARDHPPDGGLGRLPAHPPRRGPVLRPAGSCHRPGVLRSRQP